MPSFITIILFTILIILCVNMGAIYRLNSTLSEINDRQKLVVVEQHKAIQDMIRDVCKR
jgi:hypothetical protein